VATDAQRVPYAEEIAAESSLRGGTSLLLDSPSALVGSNVPFTSSLSVAERRTALVRFPAEAPGFFVNMRGGGLNTGLVLALGMLPRG
jgi:hypothetical protein